MEEKKINPEFQTLINEFVTEINNISKQVESKSAISLDAQIILLEAKIKNLSIIYLKLRKIYIEHKLSEHLSDYQQAGKLLVLLITNLEELKSTSPLYGLLEATNQSPKINGSSFLGDASPLHKIFGRKEKKSKCSIQ